MNNIVKLAVLIFTLPMAASAATYNVDYVFAYTSLKGPNVGIVEDLDLTADIANANITISSPSGADNGIDYTNGTAYQNDSGISRQSLEGFYTSGQPGYSRYQGNTTAAYKAWAQD